MARPCGTYGELAKALLEAAADEPGTVRELAARACVGYAAARFTASRMLARGDLVVHIAGRPAMVGLPFAVETAAPVLLQSLISTWRSGIEQADLAQIEQE